MLPYKLQQQLCYKSRVWKQRFLDFYHFWHMSNAVLQTVFFSIDKGQLGLEVEEEERRGEDDDKKNYKDWTMRSVRKQQKKKACQLQWAAWFKFFFPFMFTKETNKERAVKNYKWPPGFFFSCNRKRNKCFGVENSGCGTRWRNVLVLVHFLTDQSTLIRVKWHVLFNLLGAAALSRCHDRTACSWLRCWCESVPAGQTAVPRGRGSDNRKRTTSSRVFGFRVFYCPRSSSVRSEGITWVVA